MKRLKKNYLGLCLITFLISAPFISNSQEIVVETNNKGIFLNHDEVNIGKNAHWLGGNKEVAIGGEVYFGPGSSSGLTIGEGEFSWTSQTAPSIIPQWGNTATIGLGPKTKRFWFISARTVYADGVSVTSDSAYKRM